MAHYTKTYSSPAQLVTLLQSRGLHVENVARTENYLRHIGYYRFSAYLYPLLTTPKENHVFKPGATFNHALDMYRFDRHLRLLMFNEIEKIEIAVRSAIVNITSRETGNPFWMTDPTCEILPLGVLTRIYDNIRSNQIRKKIAQEFSLGVPVFNSWMTIITVARNNSGHHARVWNRTFALRVLTQRRMARPWIAIPVNQKKAYFSLCIIKYFLDTSLTSFRRTTT